MRLLPVLILLLSTFAVLIRKPMDDVTRGMSSSSYTFNISNSNNALISLKTMPFQIKIA